MGRIYRIANSLISQDLVNQVDIVSMKVDAGKDLPRAENVSRGVDSIRHRFGFIGSKVLNLVYFYFAVLFGSRKKKYTYVAPHNVAMLPLAVLLRFTSNSKIIYSPHELETEKLNLFGLRRWIAKKIEKYCIKYVHSVIVVGDEINNWYKKKYRLTRVYTIRNIPASRAISPFTKNDKFRQKFKIDKDQLIFIYQGKLISGRGINELLESFSKEVYQDFHLVFMGYGDMEEKIVNYSNEYKNIHFQTAVPPEEILNWTSGADIGIYLAQSHCLSYKFQLPNKIFEFLLSGLPVLTTNLPELKSVVEENGVGWLIEEGSKDISLREIKNLGSDGFSEILKRISSFQEVNTWENEMKTLSDAII